MSDKRFANELTGESQLQKLHEMERARDLLVNGAGQCKALFDLDDSVELGLEDAIDVIDRQLSTAFKEAERFA